MICEWLYCFQLLPSLDQWSDHILLLLLIAFVVLPKLIVEEGLGIHLKKLYLIVGRLRMSYLNWFNLRGRLVSFLAYDMLCTINEACLGRLGFSSFLKIILHEGSFVKGTLDMILWMVLCYRILFHKSRFVLLCHIANHYYLYFYHFQRILLYIVCLIHLNSSNIQQLNSYLLKKVRYYICL